MTRRAHGWNQAETDLTPATVQSSRFGLIATLDVDGNVPRPAAAGVEFFAAGWHYTRNILIVATGNDTVYAYDTSDYSLIWKRNLGKAQTSADVGCYDVRPGYGISGTPGHRAHRRECGENIPGRRNRAEPLQVPEPVACAEPRHRQGCYQPRDDRTLSHAERRLDRVVRPAEPVEPGLGSSTPTIPSTSPSVRTATIIQPG